ncbi:hypothetical protein KRR40_12005 [Niabella defluvii]|nr:hypothetical protein KRR40_12005 [Niabella sp. I65]
MMLWLGVVLYLSELLFFMYSYSTIVKLEKELAGTGNIRLEIEKLIISIERNFNRTYWAGV